MITIGENLKLERFEVKGYDETEIHLINVTSGSRTLALVEILKVELLGIKNNSGYSGTMEWGMTNPTFILPVNLWNIILNWFKRQNDELYCKVTIAAGEQFVLCCSRKLYKEISRKV